MSSSAQFLNPSEAARRLGVSAKALRLYEQRGLVTPGRTAAGWRAYGPDEMARAAEIVALRALGLSLAQVARVLGGDPQGLEPALAAHQATLEGRIRQLAGTDREGPRPSGRSRAGQAPDRRGTGAPARTDRRVQRRLRSSLALGRRAVRAARHPGAELHHRPAGQRQDAAGHAPGRDPARRRLPGPGPAGGRRRGGAGATGRRPGTQGAGRSDVGLARRGRRYGVGGAGRPARRAGIAKARPSWSSTWWSRGWTRPPRRP